MLLELFLEILGYTTLDYKACQPNSGVIECKISQEEIELLQEVEKLDLDN